jgi:hypothetical protein
MGPDGGTGPPDALGTGVGAAPRTGSGAMTGMWMITRVAASALGAREPVSLAPSGSLVAQANSSASRSLEA